MVSCNQTIRMTEESNVSSGTADNTAQFPSINAPKGLLLDRLLLIVKAIVEYGFGIYVGSVVGRLLGWYVGTVYVEHSGPVCFSDLTELELWRSIPHDFAEHGAIVGAVVGIAAIVIISRKLVSERVVSLYEKGVTEPKRIARALCKNETQIIRLLSRLARKGRIERKHNGFKEKPGVAKAGFY